MKRLLWMGWMLCLLMPVRAQMEVGMTGLIHTPTAEMEEWGTAKLGAHFINREMMNDGFKYKGSKYHTGSYYLNITALPWLELSYSCYLFKAQKKGSTTVGYFQKDRSYGAKVRVLKEKKWWPQMALGCMDPYTTSGKTDLLGGDVVNRYFSVFYAVGTKHVELKGAGTLGLNLAYRYYPKEINHKWNGVVGGITYAPAFAPYCRAMAEYTGNEWNVGVEALLWKHLRMQVSMLRGTYFSGGIAYQVKL